MWIKIDHDGLQKWKPKTVDVWIDVTDNQTAQVSKETGEQLIADYEVVTNNE